MFDRLINLIGRDNVEKISKLNILLVGIGGVGGFALEALVRTGVKNITIIDGDTFSLSNVNRQILCKHDNIGKNKVDEAIIRAKNINPNININGIVDNISANNIDSLGVFDYIIDACDDVLAKIELLKYANNKNIKIIMALGTGKKLDPTQVKITTLNKTCYDPLAKKMRIEAKKIGLNLNIPVVYSEESPINNNQIIASSIFVPSVVGITMVYYIINDIINSNK